MMMMIKDRTDIKPVLVKFGMALALSFAGFLYSRNRTKRIKPPPPPPPNSGSDKSHKTVDYQGRSRVYDDPQPETNSTGAYDKQCFRVRVDSSLVHASRHGKYIGDDRDGFLLPEFDQVVKEINVVNSPKRVLKSATIKNLPKSLTRMERDDYEQEIENLKNRIRFLVERERKLEVQLLEYYGLEEQQNAVMELQNRLKINSIEAKLFLMKIENLKAENNRLEAQVADYSKVVSELEAANAKIKLLKRKIRYEAEHHREQILDLTQRVVKLHEQEQEQEKEHEVSTCISEDPPELQRLTEVEAEAEELRKHNEKLQRENADLAHRLESTQILANSFFEDPEKEELYKTLYQLREENEKLTKEVERLQEDRCSEVEELVYLRWINACLRYELRNYQPPPGKTVARDLSKCLSPTSEHKAKQLILEYANTEDGIDKEPPNFMDFDFDNDQWPSLQSSYLTDSTDQDENSGPSSFHKPHSKKIKFFSALRKIVRGLSINHRNHSQSSRSSPMFRSLSVDDLGKRYDETGHNWSRSNPQSPKMASSSQYSNSSSMEFNRLASLAEEDENANKGNHVRSSSLSGVRFTLGRETTEDGSLDYTTKQDSESAQRSELAKYAEVFRETSWLQKHRKASSFSVR